MKTRFAGNLMQRCWQHLRERPLSARELARESSFDVESCREALRRLRELGAVVPLGRATRGWRWGASPECPGVVDRRGRPRAKR